MGVSGSGLPSDSHLDRPLLVYDGECPFCIFWVARLKELTGDRAEYRPFQEIAGGFPNITRQKFEEAVQLIMPGGQLFSGAEAVFHLMALIPRWGWLVRLYRDIPGAAAISEAGYRFVAKHRDLFRRLTKLVMGGSG